MANNGFFSGLEGLLGQAGGLFGQVADSGLLQQLGLLPSSGVSYPTVPMAGMGSGGAGGLVGGAGAAALMELLGQLTAGGGAGSVVETGGGFLGIGGDETFTKPTSQARRWATEVVVNDDDLGMRVFRNMGRPVLYSGDLAACRRVDRVAKRAARARGRRRPR